MKLINEENIYKSIIEVNNLRLWGKFAKVETLKEEFTEIIEFVITKSDSKKPLYKIDLGINNSWYYDREGYINIVDNAENILIHFSSILNKFDEYNIKKSMDNVFLKKNTNNIKIEVAKIKKQLQEKKIKREKEENKNIINNIFKEIEKECINKNLNVRFCNHYGFIAILQFSNKYSKNDIDRLSDKYIINSIKDNDIQFMKFKDKDFKILYTRFNGVCETYEEIEEFKKVLDFVKQYKYSFSL